MTKKIAWVLFLLPTYLFAQELAPLTVEKIMRDPRWIGTSPSNVFWSPDSDKIYFQWNPNRAESDSLYFISLDNHNPRKASVKKRRMALAMRSGDLNKERTQLVFVKGNRLFLFDIDDQERTPIIETTRNIRNPRFRKNGSSVIFRQGNNLYMKNLETGFLKQLTNFVKGKPEKEETRTEQEEFLRNDALKNSEILRQNVKEKKRNQKIAKKHSRSHRPEKIYIGQKNIRYITLSPNAEYIIYELVKRPDVKKTTVPTYVTESGYTDTFKSRPVVGTKRPEFTTYIYDREEDTAYTVGVKDIPGIRDIPEFMKHYPEQMKKLKKDPPLRSVFMSKPFWNKKGTRAFLVIRALDHKDRWLMGLNFETGNLKLIDRQHDDAWIGGPGIGYPRSTGNVGWVNENTIWYQSEKTGYSHIYTDNVVTGEKRALTQGKYAVFDAHLSPDRETFYLTSNKVHPGQRQFYHVDVESGEMTRITHKFGGNQAIVSPDGEHVAILHSTDVHPPELYLKENEADAELKQITNKAESPEFESYNWRDPEIFTFTNRDGQQVYAQVYVPENPAPGHPGVIFIHGAGYLQDVKYTWSKHYFREHLFMNLLVDRGYTVMNIDYRGSKGYGRDWRTAIYRHMGGNDLEDIVDGAQYLVENYKVNPENLGVWGGSYGGFLTLMAMFKTDQFTSGGALRSVTDWAHYNQPYTSDILNLPQNDSIAYARSSPINFAKGFEGHLLMAHGMLDPNVLFQDIVRLSQKLIELGKENWELAVYPLEGHGFTEPSSWTDEYKRILELFEKTLKPKSAP